MTTIRPTVDFKKNPTQVQELFFRRILGAAKGTNPYRSLFYGGGIRGGKTYVCLVALAHLCRQYPNSRWHIFRNDFPALLSTSIPSMEKIIGNSPNWSWSRDRSNYFLVHSNGSRIYFKGENLERDPELNDLLGLETNGILYEQIEELSKNLWDMGQTRLGSWYCDPMPKPITLSTFNPTQTWIKSFVYEPWRNDTLPPTFFYQMALPTDNGYITADQWENWGRLSERSKLQLIQGDWTDFSQKDNLWAFAFDRAKHIGEPIYDRNQQTYLSFDFNRNPITCSVVQHHHGCINVIECIKLPNSDIYKLCDRIKATYPNVVFLITGDASGQSSSAMVRDNLNYYTVIRAQLPATTSQIRVPTVNPPLADNQVLVNSLLSNYKVQIHKDKASALIYDLGNVRMEANGTIVKSNRSDAKQQADALDTFRYWCNVFMKGYLGQSF